MAATWTNRDGTPIPLALTFFPPHQLIQDGEVIADYGADLTAGLGRYDQLCRQRLNALGIDPTPRRVEVH